MLYGFVYGSLVGCGAGVQVEPSTISASGTGTATVSPDVVDVQLGVETVSDNPAEAIGENTTKMNAVMNVLKDMEVAETDIQTLYYSMWVEQVYDENRQPTNEFRYHVANTVNIRLHDLTKIGSLLESATRAGANNISGITFGVADTEELEQNALDNALANARQKAERIAADMNVTLGKVKYVSEGGGYTAPVAYYGEKLGVGGGGGAVPISGGQFTYSMTVQVVFEISP
ncbi:MAG: SIMPL domain-containing protein [Chloroflexota bacterium]